MTTNSGTKGALTHSLDVLADKVGDPTPLIYAELFRRHPEHEGRFFMDLDGGVRGEMLSQALDVLMRADENSPSAGVLVEANRFAHFGYGIEDDQFNAFFIVIRDVVKASLESDWTAEYENRWAQIIDDLTATKASA